MPDASSNPLREDLSMGSSRDTDTVGEFKNRWSGLVIAKRWRFRSRASDVPFFQNENGEKELEESLRAKHKSVLNSSLLRLKHVED